VELLVGLTRRALAVVVIFGCGAQQLVTQFSGLFLGRFQLGLGGLQLFCLATAEPVLLLLAGGLGLVCLVGGFFFSGGPGGSLGFLLRCSGRLFLRCGLGVRFGLLGALGLGFFAHSWSSCLLPDMLCPSLPVK